VGLGILSQRKNCQLIKGIKDAFQIAAFNSNYDDIAMLFTILRDSEHLLKEGAGIHAHDTSVQSLCSDSWADLPQGVLWPRSLLRLSGSRETPLMLAAGHGSVAIVRRLLKSNEVHELIKERRLQWDLRLLRYFGKVSDSNLALVYNFEDFRQLLIEHRTLVTLDMVL
jgi:hypothetical protein